MNYTLRIFRVSILLTICIFTFLVSNPISSQDESKEKPESSSSTTSSFDFGDTKATRDPFSLLKHENEEILSYSLEKCIAMCLTDNFTLQSTALEPRIAEAERTLAESQFDFILSLSSNFSKSKKGSGSNPLTGSQRERWVNSIGLAKSFDTGTYVTIGFSFTKTDSDATFDTVTDQGGFSITIRQSLLKNFGFTPNRYSIRLAEISKQLADAQFDQQKLELIYNVESVFWNEIFAIEDYKVTFTALKLVADEVEIFKRKREAGLATNINVFAAKAQLENKRRDLIEKAKVVRDSSDALLALIAPDKILQQATGGVNFIIRPSEYSLDISTELERRFDVQKEIRTALNYRPEIKQTEFSLKSAVETIEYRENQLLPDLSLKFGFTFGGGGKNTGEAFENIWKTTNTEWEVGLEFTFPLGNMNARGEYQRAKFKQEQASFSHRANQVQVITEILKSIRNIQAARMTFKASVQAKEYAEKQLMAENRRRERGLSTDFQVQKFQNDLEEAQRNEISARINLKLAYIGLEKANGSLPNRYKKAASQ